jgi:hypothetical protein
MKKDINEIGCIGMVWIDFTQDRNKWLGLVNMVMYILSFLNDREFLDCLGYCYLLKKGHASWS